MIKFKQKFDASGIREGLRTMWKGFKRVVCGAAVAGMIVAAGYCFAGVPGKSGYMAVLFFAAGMVSLAFALWQMWVIGGGKKRTGSFEK